MADLVFASSPILRPADRLIRANDLHPASRAGVDDQTKSVQFDDGRNQIEPEADAGRAANLVGAIESAQHRFMFLFADSRTRIRHAQDGLALAARIHQTDVPPAVVMLTVTEASELAGATLAAGALGYVTKARAATDLVPALEAALAGRPFVSSPSRWA